MSKGDAIPTRFEAAQDAELDELAKRTQLSKSVIIRAAVEMLLREAKKRGGKLGWIVDELELKAPARAPRQSKQAKRVTKLSLNEDAPEYGAKKKQGSG